MKEKVINEEIVYEGHTLSVSNRTVQLASGHKSNRDIILFPKVAVILPFEPPDKIHLIQQYRTAAEQTLLEVPAGKIDPNEAPVDGAKRELEEATGITATSWTLLGESFATPGFCTEYMYFYLARDLSFGDTHLDEDEIIEQKTVTISERDSLIDRHKIHDNKTMLCYLLSKPRLQ